MDARDREARPGFMDELTGALGFRDEWEAGLVRAEHILLEVHRLRREAGEEGARRTARPFHFRSAKSVQLAVPQLRHEDDPRSDSLWFIAPAEAQEVSSLFLPHIDPARVPEVAAELQPLPGDPPLRRGHPPRRVGAE
jgi:hypothetical protein